MLEQQILIIKERDGWRVERREGDLSLVFNERYVSSGLAIEAATLLFSGEEHNFELVDETGISDDKLRGSTNCR